MRFRILVANFLDELCISFSNINQIIQYNLVNLYVCYSNLCNANVYYFRAFSLVLRSKTCMHIGNSSMDFELEKKLK